MFPENLIKQADELLSICREKNIKLCTAESCTGGLIIGLLTEISGSSDVVDRGFITYSNQAKMELLNVSKDILNQYGAVSEQTVRAMTSGALSQSKADIAIAVSGIAGPTGGSTTKPVGLVHIATQHKSLQISHQEFNFGDIGRTNIRIKTIAKALEMTKEICDGC